MLVKESAEAVRNAAFVNWVPRHAQQSGWARVRTRVSFLCLVVSAVSAFMCGFSCLCAGMNSEARNYDDETWLSIAHLPTMGKGARITAMPLCLGLRCFEPLHSCSDSAGLGGYKHSYFLVQKPFVPIPLVSTEDKPTLRNAVQTPPLS